MKLKNILSVLCFFFVVVACSMEDDVLDGNSSKLVPEEGSAYVSAVINLGGTQTKATTGNSSAPEEYAAEAIASCALFLLDSNDKVVGVHTETYTNSNATSQEIRFLTKVNVATKAVAVVNYNPNNSENILACSTYQEIQAYKEYDANYRIKVGEGTISWTGITGSASTTGTLEEAKVDITVKSRTAIVELVNFDVKFEGAGNEPNVQLTEVSFSNLKSEGGLYSEGSSFADVFSFTNNLPIGKGVYGKNGYFRKNVYPNTTEVTPVTLNLKFTVDGKSSPEFERSYIINRPTSGGFVNNSGHEYVQPGYWYQLSATVTVNTNKINCDIECHVLDWEYKSIDAGDIYPNK